MVINALIVSTNIAIFTFYVRDAAVGFHGILTGILRSAGALNTGIRGHTVRIDDAAPGSS